ncbi:hypothetical protein CYY_007465 [Polysphondylium violaceum]|uniref:Transmembrane protein n=1 Tax=Polysphondylium violaceum TaxID=133409 RepID=A0A8J4PPP7_9MYCE|nr:hypothetical protein CYY_007465 [Polysphondylium violaceum]
MNHLGRLLIGYGAAVNVGAAGLFYYDKQQAIAHKWRVRESTLQLTALFGGWIGGLYAMQTFKHKRAKQSFKNVYFAAIGGNLAMIAGSFVVFKRYPHLIPNSIRVMMRQAQQKNHNQQQSQHINQIQQNSNSNNNNNFRQRKQNQYQQQQEEINYDIEEQPQQTNNRKRRSKKNKNVN